ncbi:replication protein A 70 kDa DNA-binding subunit-like [Nilaparvata lugens]|uniref:replication protein A 70 kDa DNA-binding subunit-like n=1 Tax=Nilaparvata lugens TaxID=108931 RepID=UPI00193E55AA|nr:replication protein A 70 kDa DNA-binding subunit-like [Nilaparvata lugens]
MIGGGFGRQTKTPLQSGVEMSPMSGQRTHPIAYLSPYQNKWVIKARVLSKSAVKTWSNARGEGKLFSMDLADESGEIRVTAFRDQVDKFYDMIEVNKVYLISRCQLKQANKKFTSLKNDYEMTCTSETRIEPCTEDCGDIPKMKFNFTSLVALQEAPLENSVDVIGVCKRVGDLATVIQRTTNKELKKRDIELVDNSLSSISVTLWNNDAENFEVNGGEPIVAIRQAGLSDFGGGRSLSVRASSNIQINPDIPEAHKLRGWYDALSHDAKFNSLSARGGAMDGGMFNSKAITLKEAKNQNTDSDKAEFFSAFAHVMHIRTENVCYKACPSSECNKKVVDLNTGEYRCEKCNRASPNFKYRLLINMQIADISDAQWVSAFQDVAELLLNTTADDVGNMLSDEKAIEQLFQVPLFSCYNIRLRSKVETFNDEMRRKVVVVSMKPVDNGEYAKFLLKELQEMTGVSTSN